MNVLLYLKNLYAKENSLLNHITLFAMLGIFTVSTMAYLSTIIGNIYGSFFDFAPTTSVKAYFLLVLALMLLFLFIGYIYSYINNSFNEKNELPEVSLSAYSAFVKTLPVVISWNIYEAFLFLIGFVTIPATTKLFYIYYSILICILPFINLISVAFAKNFKYRPSLFSFITIFRVLNQSLGEIIKLCLQTLLLSIIPAGIIFLMIKYSATISPQTLNLIAKLASLCFATYFIMIIKLVYSQGLVEIVKDKLSDI